MDPTLKSYLEKNNIQYKTHEHHPVFTVAESKNIKQDIPCTHTKSLFLRDDQNNFHLVCLQADKRLDIKALEKTLEVKKLRFATSEELHKHLQVTPGSVSLFSIIHDPQTQLLIDHDLMNAEAVGFHPNINKATLVTDHDNLKKFYDSLPNEKHVVELA